MAIRSLRDAPVDGKRVLLRVDFNVPMDGDRISDDTRIQAALPTIEFLRKRDARVILCSHLGRPKGKPDDKFRLGPIADRLAELLGISVARSKDVVGPDAHARAAKLGPGE